MASTYNFTNGTVANHDRQRTHAAMENGPYIIRHIVDFSKQTLDVSASDVAQVLSIPAGVIVLDAWLRVITAEGSGAVLSLGYGSDTDKWGRNLAMDATGIPSRILTGSETYDAASVADAASLDNDITVTGAALGDIALVTMGIDVAGLSVSAQVTVADTVTMTLQNNTGGAVDLASTTAKAYVYKTDDLVPVPVYFSSADTIDLLSGGSVDIDGLKVEVCAKCLKAISTL